MRYSFCRFIAPALLCYSVGAAAELGGPVSTIATEQARIDTTLRTQNIAGTGSDVGMDANANYSVHERTTEIGTLIREYADASGTVFAVTWQGPAKPDLDLLLGRYFQTFVAAPSQPGTGPKQINQPDLVVFSGGHPRAFVGRAYLPGLIPTGVDINALP
ncbi:MAG: DUF2844 domain-containing protein [Spongiibacteraceae bacterium]